MSFKSLVKDRILTIILLIFGIITIEILLIPYPVGKLIKYYIPIAILGLYFTAFIVQYYTRKKFYSNLTDTLNDLEEKYLVAEIIKSPEFLEGEILRDILQQVDKSMIENVKKYRDIQEDYKDFIELWIHEIKIPIATSKMIVENNKNPITKSINEELDKVENYIEQALFYARSNTVEKDYYIKKNNLKNIVNESIKKNKIALIQEKAMINIYDLDIEVNTDSKWVVFILNQVIQNSIKYRKENLKIDMYAKEKKENVILYIKDNGEGIKESEVTRVFEKGFTGTNGRLTNKKSTGIGLYLCKKLCDKLGIGINVKSIYKKGTEVQLIFPQNSLQNKCLK